eukprot:IDg7887t1
MLTPSVIRKITLKRKLYYRRKTFLCRKMFAFSTVLHLGCLDEMREAIIAAWERVVKEALQSHVKTMPERCQNIAEKRGVVRVIDRLLL